MNMEKVIWATHLTYTFIIRIKYYNYKLQNCKLQYVKKKRYINSYLELKKVPIEDANLDKSLVKRDHIWESQYPKVQAWRYPNEQHQSHFYTDFQAKARAQGPVRKLLVHTFLWLEHPSSWGCATGQESITTDLENIFWQTFSFAFAVSHTVPGT